MLGDPRAGGDEPVSPLFLRAWDWRRGATRGDAPPPPGRRGRANLVGNFAPGLAPPRAVRSKLVALAACPGRRD